MELARDLTREPNQSGTWYGRITRCRTNGLVCDQVAETNLVTVECPSDLGCMLRLVFWYQEGVIEAYNSDSSAIALRGYIRINEGDI
jgi:hypothetical protein